MTGNCAIFANDSIFRSNNENIRVWGPLWITSWSMGRVLSDCIFCPSHSWCCNCLLGSYVKFPVQHRFICARYFNLYLNHIVEIIHFRSCCWVKCNSPWRGLLSKKWNSSSGWYCYFYYFESDLNFISLIDNMSSNSTTSGFDEIWDQFSTVPLFLILVVFPLINLRSATFFTRFNALGNSRLILLKIIMTISMQELYPSSSSWLPFFSDVMSGDWT